MGRLVAFRKMRQNRPLMEKVLCGDPPKDAVSAAKKMGIETGRGEQGTVLIHLRALKLAIHK
jgi:hypothetical protein